MGKPFDEREDPRRDFLVKALAMGMFAVSGSMSPGTSDAQLFGRRPRKLGDNESIYELAGPVTINGQPVSRDARIAAGDVVETGKRGRIVFVVGTDAYFVRENSRLELEGSGFLATTLRIAAGAVLSVFGKGERLVRGPTSTIGIRGTGLYIEAEPDMTYVCTCYGEVNIAAADDPTISENIVSRHHDAPRYVLADGAGERIRPAPFKNHTDIELMLLEALVGRTPPFSLFDEDYGSPRRY
jgi:hypothetical protein